MKTTNLRPIILMSIALITASMMAKEAKLVEVEVELGRGFDLKSIGGPDKILTINSETTSTIRYTIVDPRQMREVIRYDALGYPYSELVAVGTPQSVSKSNGIRLSGTLSRFYPLYSDDKLTVYFFDTLATRQNHRKLIIEYKSPHPTR